MSHFSAAQDALRTYTALHTFATLDDKRALLMLLRFQVLLRLLGTFGGTVCNASQGEGSFKAFAMHEAVFCLAMGG